MEIKISIPLENDILNQGLIIKVALKDESYSKNQLYEYADLSGVYIHHCDGKILYIGKATDGQWGNFGERLRREFQESSSQKQNPFILLASQTKPIKTVFYDLDTIDSLIISEIKILNLKSKALIFEQVLIGVYKPQGNNI